MLLKQSQTAKVIPFLLVLSSDHITGATGLTPTVTLSKNGAAFAAPAGAVTELSSGWYTIAGNATDTGTLGSLLLHATGTGADPTDDRHEVVGFDPDAATVTLASAERNAIADAILDRDMATGTDSGSPTVRTVRQALRALRNKFSFSGSTRSVFKEDDTTASWTSVVTTDAAAVPIVSDDPA